MSTKFFILIGILIVTILVWVTCKSRKPIYVGIATCCLVIAIIGQCFYAAHHNEEKYNCKAIIFYDSEGIATKRYKGKFKVLLTKDHYIKFESKYGKIYEVEFPRESVAIIGA